MRVVGKEVKRTFVMCCVVVDGVETRREDTRPAPLIQLD